jgi:hypothetical protein
MKILPGQELITSEWLRWPAACSEPPSPTSPGSPGSTAPSANLTHVPAANLAILIIGMPLAATIAGWLLAGREPPVIARQPIEYPTPPDRPDGIADGPNAATERRDRTPQPNVWSVACPTS